MCSGSRFNVSRFGGVGLGLKGFVFGGSEFSALDRSSFVPLLSSERLSYNFGKHWCLDMCLSGLRVSLILTCGFAGQDEVLP